jgi:DNA-binding CsgD family transcriptional regulator
LPLGELDRLVDRIYEAAAISEFWPAVLDDIARFTESDSASFHSVRDHTVRAIGTPAANWLIEEFRPFAQTIVNTRTTRGRGRAEFGFLTDFDLFTPEELAREPFYRDFLYPRGFGWFAGTTFDVPNGEAIHLGIGRRRARGPFEQKYVTHLDGLRSHLARATLLTARLEMERAKGMTAALELLGLPAAVLNDRHRLVTANAPMQGLIPGVFEDRHERFCVVDGNAQPLFAGAMAELARPGADASVRSIPVAARDEQPPYILHLVPVRRAARDIFARAVAILVVTPVARALVPSAAVVKGLFDLTPAEARVACGIGEARTIEALATQLGVSRETVRVQLKAVLAKTGLHRQAELASLLSGLALRR